MPATNEYNSNNVGHSVPNGGGIAIKKPDASALGTFVFESFNRDRDAGAIMRNNYAGGAGGFVMNDDTVKQNTATAVIQIDSDTEERPYAGCYFDADMGHGAERWICHKTGDVFSAGTPWTMSTEWLKDHFEVTTPPPQE